MKRQVCIIAAFLLSACVVRTESVEGETGPQGETGSQGETGPQGEQGVSPFSYVDPIAMTDIYYSDGRVGVGTAAPAELLDVNGNVHLNGSITTANQTTHTTWRKLSTPQPWVAGYWKLVTPIDAFKVNAFSIHITVYRYGIGGPPQPPPADLGGSPLEVRCSGYGYPNTGLIKADCQAEGSGDPVGIGTENQMVVIAVGSKDYEQWYDDHATFDYVGEEPVKESDFQWIWVEDETAPFANHNQVVIDDVKGTVSIGAPDVSFDAARGIDIFGDTDAAIRLRQTDSGKGDFEIRSTREGSGNMLQIREGDDALLTIRSDANDGSTWDRGHVGIGTTNPVVALDVNGAARLAKYAVQPFGCDSYVDGALILTDKYRTCACDGMNNNWVRTSDGVTPCWP